MYEYCVYTVKSYMQQSVKFALKKGTNVWHYGLIFILGVYSVVMFDSCLIRFVLKDSVPGDFIRLVLG